MTDVQMDRALNKLIERLAKLGANDEGVLTRVLEIRDRMMLPMATVLERVPGVTLVQKCATIGVTRQTVYLWRKGMSRPSEKQSRRLAELTGFAAEDIEGRTKPLSFAARTARAASTARGI